MIDKIGNGRSFMEHAAALSMPIRRADIASYKAKEEVRNRVIGRGIAFEASSINSP